MKFVLTKTSDRYVENLDLFFQLVGRNASNEKWKEMIEHFKARIENEELIIEVNSLEDLMLLMEYFDQEIVVSKGKNAQYIEIYDCYRE